MKFIPLDDLGDDADAIVARIKAVADEDKAMLDSVNTNFAVQEEDDDLPWHRKVTRRLRGEGNPH
jgi:hypothetical protein